MTVFESYHSARTYGYPIRVKTVCQPDQERFPTCLGLYLVLRIGELFITGKYTLICCRVAHQPSCG